MESCLTLSVGEAIDESESCTYQIWRGKKVERVITIINSEACIAKVRERNAPTNEGSAFSDTLINERSSHARSSCSVDHVLTTSILLDSSEKCRERGNGTEGGRIIPVGNACSLCLLVISFGGVKKPAMQRVEQIPKH